MWLHFFESLCTIHKLIKNASFNTHDMKPIQSMCKLLYAVFDLFYSVTSPIPSVFPEGNLSDEPAIPNSSIKASFDTHDMKSMYCTVHSNDIF